MKVVICDICRNEDKLSYGKWRFDVKKEGLRFAADLCDEHKNYFKGKEYDQCVEEFHAIAEKPHKDLEFLFEGLKSK